MEAWTPYLLKNAIIKKYINGFFFLFFTNTVFVSMISNNKIKILSMSPSSGGY